MSVVVPTPTNRVHCVECPLRALSAFRPFSGEELEFVAAFKRGEFSSEAGSTILSEGAHSPHLFTLLSGWAFRFKTLSDGRRQILNYILPGDLVGLQGSLLGEMRHAVEALTPVVLCVFQRDRIAELYRCHPGLGFDVTWLASREERMLDENLLSLGRRSALERAAYLLAFIHQRATSLGLGAQAPLMIPVSQQHVADTLGLSIVHTNKTLRKLIDRGFIAWHDRACEVIDASGLRQVADWDGVIEGARPLI